MLLNQKGSYLVLVAGQFFLLVTMCIDTRPETIFRLASFARELIITEH